MDCRIKESVESGGRVWPMREVLNKQQLGLRKMSPDLFKCVCATITVTATSFLRIIKPLLLVSTHYSLDSLRLRLGLVCTIARRTYQACSSLYASLLVPHHGTLPFIWIIYDRPRAQHLLLNWPFPEASPTFFRSTDQWLQSFNYPLSYRRSEYWSQDSLSNSL